MSALTTAFELTDSPNWRDEFDSVTVYQLGWRLGGKGASGRGKYDRIEEHGVHIWMGFYENAFRVIRKVYGELNRPKGALLARWDDAFKRHSLVVVGDYHDGRWKKWSFDFPNRWWQTPGNQKARPHSVPTLWNYIAMILWWMSIQMPKLPPALIRAKNRSTIGDPWGQRLRVLIKAVLDSFALLFWATLLILVRILAALLPSHPQRPRVRQIHDWHQRMTIRTVDGFFFRLVRAIESEMDEDDQLRRLFIVLDLASSVVVGLLREGVLFDLDGLEALDKYDFREFLEKYDASPETRDSGVVRGLYDMAFAYQQGRPEQPSFAAGTLLRCAMRIVFTYRGAIFWKMQAGMGDTIFAPLYLVLKKRGVRFEFFHRVTNLGLSHDQNSVARIDLVRQVGLKAQGVIENPEYNPIIVTTDGLQCWPNAPLYDQIVVEHAQAVVGSGIDLESNVPRLPRRENLGQPEEIRQPEERHEEPITLRAGTDFDIVVLGIPLGALPIVCDELIKAKPRWKTMVDEVETARTLSVQLWLKPKLDGLVDEPDWRREGPIMDAYEQPLDTWADMSHLIPRESWPEGQIPGSIAYFCGPMPDASDPSETPDEALANLRSAADAWFRNAAGQLWPLASDPNNRDGLNTDLVTDRFDRVNVDPSERYVLSVKGSTEHRLMADRSGCDNLYLAGDWVRTPLSAGCIEAAVMAGMFAASAICGRPRPEEIIGEHWPPPADGTENNR